MQFIQPSYATFKLLTVLVACTALFPFGVFACRQDVSTDEMPQMIAACQEKLVAVDQKDHTSRAEILMIMAKLAYKLDDYEQSEQHLHALSLHHSEYLNHPENKFDWLYHMARTQLRKGDFKNSALNFREARMVAKTLEKPRNEGYSLNGLGLAYEKQQLYELALKAYQESLQIKRTYGKPGDMASTLNNIAGIYYKLENYHKALQYLKQIHDTYEALIDKHPEVLNKYIHSKENIGISYLQLGQPEHAAYQFTEAIELSEQNDLMANQIHLKVLLSRSLRLHQETEAAFWVLNTLGTDPAISENYQSLLDYELATHWTQKGDWIQADHHIRKGQSQMVFDSLIKQTDFIQLRADWHEAQGNHESALQSFKEYTSLREHHLKDQFNQSIRNQQHEIETEQNNFKIQLLGKENALQSVTIERQRLLILNAILVLMMAIIYLLYLKKKRAVLQASLDAEIKEHKQKIGLLESSKSKLIELLEKSNTPMLCIDSSWRIVFCHEGFAKSLGIKNQPIIQEKLESQLPRLHAVLSEQLERHTDMPRNQVVKAFKPDHSTDRMMDLQVVNLHLNDDFTVISTTDTSVATPIQMILSQEKSILNTLTQLQKQFNLSDDAIAIMQSELEQKLLTQPTDSSSEGAFRTHLVHLMQECLSIWTQVTQSNRVELADSSGFWKITIDDGRLRTRALDRYLDTKKLPKKPRWRQVVKTAHFILATCELNTKQRDHLNNVLDQFMIIMKKQTL